MAQRNADRSGYVRLIVLALGEPINDLNFLHLVGAGNSAVPADQVLHSFRHSRVLDVATVVSSSGSEALPVQRYPRLNRCRNKA